MRFSTKSFGDISKVKRGKDILKAFCLSNLFGEHLVNNLQHAIFLRQATLRHTSDFHVIKPLGHVIMSQELWNVPCLKNNKRS